MDGNLQMVPRSKQSRIIFLELLVISLWTLWVCAPYLNFDPTVYPAGRELRSTIAAHHLWPNLLECGSCAFWNGDQRGGLPAFADVASSALNPIVAIPTLILGVVNGSKMALLLAFGLAGFAQWWIAKLLDVRPIVRVWVGMLAVSAGHMASRMELGALNVVVATAMSSLAIAAIIWLYRSPGTKPIVVLGLTLAGTALAGSGYIQVGVIALLPALAFLVFASAFKLTPNLARFLKAAVLAMLLTAPLLIPFLHFAGNFNKELDPEFKVAQPLEFMPLNLVIGDADFYRTAVLGKQAFPHLYALYIGWAPVVLAIFGIVLMETKNKYISRFMLTSIISIFLVASAIPLKFLVGFFPALAGIRHVPQISGLAVPLILGFAAYGLDQAFNWPWPKLSLGVNEKSLSIPSTLILIAILMFNLWNTKQFSHEWIGTESLTSGMKELLAELKTPTLQWVSPPFGEHFFIEPAIAAGLKISPGLTTYRWEGRDFPAPVLQASRSGPPLENSKQIGEADEVPIYQNAVPPYAAIYFSDDTYLECNSHGEGGNITVTCNPEQNGTLRLLENNYSGWMATVDGQNLPLIESEWLEVQSILGKHEYVFVYRPWDVPAGLLLSISGLLISGWLLLPRKNHESHIET